MKLALIRRQFSPTGGAELYLDRLIDRLTGSGNEVHLFSEKWEKKENVQFHPIEVNGSRGEQPMVFARNVAAALQREKWDCVFSLERTVKQDVYRAGDGVHQVWLERRREFSPAWKRFWIGWGNFHRTMCELEQAAFHPANTSRIIVNSEMVRAEILRNSQFPNNRIHLVRNGIDLRRFQHRDRVAMRKKYGLEESAKVLLFVGSGWERKGLRYVIQVYRTLKENGSNVRLLVAGKGRRPAGSGDVIFVGPVKEVEELYTAADLFLFLPIYEPSANVCIEAFAAGLPVVTTRMNGASELIRSGESGVIVDDPRETGKIAEATRRLLLNGVKVAIAPELLSLDRNVAETIAVLNLATQERKASRQ
ncbi:MAG: glycosyltransferase family 4 protein [Verrucomicrobiota bacterium]|nr:glycosyltransferase family 4 protein [Verrucomicrobiota bacterium]